MKRSICADHAYRLKGRIKRAQLNDSSCSLCKREAKPLHLQDFARELEGIAESMRFAAKDEYYDPFGVTYLSPLERILNRFYYTMHEAYRENFIKSIREVRK